VAVIVTGEPGGQPATDTVTGTSSSAVCGRTVIAASG
jgi:hypothetical protein